MQLRKIFIFEVQSQISESKQSSSMLSFVQHVSDPVFVGPVHLATIQLATIQLATHPTRYSPTPHWPTRHTLTQMKIGMYYQEQGCQFGFFDAKFTEFGFFRGFWRQKILFGSLTFFHLNLAFFEAMYRRNICLFRCFVKQKFSIFEENRVQKVAWQHRVEPIQLSLTIR